MLADLLPAGIGVLPEQVLRRHQHARCTKPALQGIAVTKGGLQVCDFATIGEALNGLDGGAICLYGKHQACANNFAVYANRAGSAYTVLAADVSSS